MMEGSLLALPFLPEYTPEYTDEFTTPSPATTAAPRRTASAIVPRHVLQTLLPTVPKPRLVVLPQLVSPASPSEFSFPSPSLSSQAVVVAGVAIAVTAGTLTQSLSQAPVYEGSFQLEAQAVTPTSPYSKSTSVQQVQPNIAPPLLLSEDVIRTLESPKVIDPVVQALQAKLSQIDYHSLVDNLTVTSNGRTLQVHYQDVSPQRVKIVLDQIAQAYIDYGRECQGEACRGIQFVSEQIPKAQQRLQELSQQIEQIHQQYGVTNLQVQVKRLETRTNDISKQQALLQGRLAEAQQTQLQLQQRMALQPNEAIANQLLSQDSRYRQLLTQFQTLDNQLAAQFGGFTTNPNDIKAIQAQHQQVMLQMTQQAQLTLREYLSNPAADAQHPVFQDETLLQLLQQSIIETHSIHMMQVRQLTLGLAQQAIEEQRSQLINLLGKYESLEQRLNSETMILQQYFNKLDLLQKKATQADIAFKVIAQPELIKDAAGQPQATIPDLQRNLGIATIVGILLGAGVLAITRRPGSTLGLNDLGGIPVDMLLSKAKDVADRQLQDQRLQVA